MGEEFGKPLLGDRLRYCTRCGLPETVERIAFDDRGICRACQSAEQKMHIDWAERGRQLEALLQWGRDRARGGYECVVPISGGKDSTFQLHVLAKVHGMKCLAVTFNHNWYSETGWYNLVNCLEELDVDHVMFTPRRSLVNRLARRSLEKIGDACWHCHAGCGAFPLQVAVKFRIPLIVYGESVSESSGRSSYDEPTMPYDREYFTRVSAKATPEEMACSYIAEDELCPFWLPSPEEMAAAELKGFHLGDYIFWDEERQMEFVRDTYGWKETDIEGAFKGFKSAECVMPGVHDFTCYLKRGYGRSSWQAFADVRAGLMTREEGFELGKAIDPQRPEALDYYLQITGYSEEEFREIMARHRVPPLQGVELPVLPKDHPCRERLLPFARQLVEKHREKILEGEGGKKDHEG